MYGLSCFEAELVSGMAGGREVDELQPERPLAYFVQYGICLAEQLVLHLVETVDLGLDDGQVGALLFYVFDHVASALEDVLHEHFEFGAGRHLEPLQLEPVVVYVLLRQLGQLGECSLEVLVHARYYPGLEQAKQLFFEALPVHFLQRLIRVVGVESFFDIGHSLAQGVYFLVEGNKFGIDEVAERLE